MKLRQIDLGLALATLLAVSLTVLFAAIAYGERHDPLLQGSDPQWPLYALGATGVSGAWLGVFGWQRKRWLVAASGFFLSLATPVGFFLELSGPFAVGLLFVSLFRAWQDRPKRRARTELSDPYRQEPGAPGSRRSGRRDRGSSEHRAPTGRRDSPGDSEPTIPSRDSAAAAWRVTPRIASSGVIFRWVHASAHDELEVLAVRRAGVEVGRQAPRARRARSASAPARTAARSSSTRPASARRSCRERASASASSSCRVLEVLGAHRPELRCERRSPAPRQLLGVDLDAETFGPARSEDLPASVRR